MQRGDKLSIKPHAPVAMNSPDAKSPIPLFWRSSMTRRFAQSSSQGAQIWVILTGERVWMITLSPTTRLPTP
jgi:hypothetical protein